MPVFMSTASGGKLDLTEPSPFDIRITDIAVHLSKLCRFMGATSGFWSVAQHSLLCEAMLPDGTHPDTRLAVLLHDAHEAYTGDIGTPVARALGGRAYLAIVNLKTEIQAAIDYAFGAYPLSDAQRAVVRDMDELALVTEKHRLTLANAEAWAGHEGPAPNMTVQVGDFVSDPNTVAVRFLIKVRDLAKRSSAQPLPSLGL